MRKIRINFRLMVIVLIGICCAYATKRPAWMDDADTYHHYAFWYKSYDKTRYYVSKDLTSAGWVAGNQYDCEWPILICTIIANPVGLHTDFYGMYFDAVNVPQSGVDSVGTFMTF
jgi:hypothetical protein